MHWDLQGDARQNFIVGEALTRCTFPFEDWPDRRVIPVEWEDLSRYASIQEGTTVPNAPLHAEVRHHAGSGAGSNDFDLLKFRNQVLGLAWYSGKVTLHTELVHDPVLGMEVFLSEGAHMLDFFGMTDPQRVAIWNAVHPPHERLDPDTRVEDGVDLGHGHGWFDVSTYYDWVGEAWMGVFTELFSDVPVSIPMNHLLQPDGPFLVHSAFGTSTPEPEPEPEPEPPDLEPERPEPWPWLVRFLRWIASLLR